MRRDEDGHDQLGISRCCCGLAVKNCIAVGQRNARGAKVGVSAMEVKVATDVGRVRENNEDSFWVGHQCLVVCDGMGGHLAGEVASELAVQTVKNYPFKGTDPQVEVRLAIEGAQKRILEVAGTEPAYNGMGTTITLAWLSPVEHGGAILTMGHVGDSRGYVFIDGVLTQLTSDHSVVGELLRSGTITSQEAREHAKRHVLTQALGSREIEIEMLCHVLPSGSLILLCTDGLSDVVDDAQISSLLEQAASCDNIAQELVDLANDLGGPDNITVIVARIP